jgi:hypothetical protein
VIEHLVDLLVPQSVLLQVSCLELIRRLVRVELPAQVTVLYDALNGEEGYALIDLGRFFRIVD